MCCYVVVYIKINIFFVILYDEVKIYKFIIYINKLKEIVGVIL